MEEPYGGHSFSDPEVVQVSQECDGVKRQQLFCEPSQGLQVIYYLQVTPYFRILTRSFVSIEPEMAELC